MRERVYLAIAIVFAIVLYVVGMTAILSMLLGAKPLSPPPPSPCSAITFKVTPDSLYAELQAPKGTRRCTVEIQ